MAGAIKLNGSINPGPEQKSGLAKMIGLGEVGVGAATGNPLLIASGVGSLAGDTPAGKLASTVGTVGGLASKGAQAATSDETLPEPTSVDDPMGRRIQNFQNDPNAVLHQGLQLANDPNLPLDYETRMAVIEPILRAKHFGYGGGLA